MTVRLTGDLPEEPEEEGFEILEALATIEDVKDFRLREFMRQHGMDETQSVLFYRELIKELRELMSFLNLLQETIDTDARAISKLKASLLSKDNQIKILEAKVGNLEGESQNKIDSLERERQKLQYTISQLQDKVESYEGLKDLLSGKKSTETLVALHHFVEDMYTDRLNERLGMRPPPDLTQLDSIRHKLRADLLEILKIPRDTLEKENIELKKLNEALKNAVSILYGGKVE